MLFQCTTQGEGGTVAGVLYIRTFSTLPVRFVLNCVFSPSLSVPLSHYAHLR